MIGHGQALWDDTGRPVRMAGSIRDISERKQGEADLRKAHDELEQRVGERTRELACANEALRKSEERYRNLAQNFPNGVVALFDPELRYTLAAGAGLGQLGITNGAFEGKTVADVIMAYAKRAQKTVVEPSARVVFELRGHRVNRRFAARKRVGPCVFPKKVARA